MSLRAIYAFNKILTLPNRFPSGLYSRCSEIAYRFDRKYRLRYAMPFEICKNIWKEAIHIKKTTLSKICFSQIRESFSNWKIKVKLTKLNENNKRSEAIKLINIAVNKIK